MPLYDETVFLHVDGIKIGAAQVDSARNRVHRILMYLPDGMGADAPDKTQEWLSRTHFHVISDVEPAPSFYLTDFSTMLAPKTCVVEPYGSRVAWVPVEPPAPDIDTSRARTILCDPKFLLWRMPDHGGGGFEPGSVTLQGRSGTWTILLTQYVDKTWALTLQSDHPSIPEFEAWSENGVMYYNHLWCPRRQKVNMGDVYDVLQLAREEMLRLTEDWVQRSQNELADAIAERSALYQHEPRDEGTW